MTVQLYVMVQGGWGELRREMPTTTTTLQHRSPTAPAQQKARVWGSEIGECWCTSTSGSKGAQLATLSAFDDPHVAPSPKALWRSWRDGAHEGRDGDAAGGQWPRRARLDGTATARRRAVATTRATRRHGDGTTAGSGHGRRAARPTPPGHPL